MGCGGTKHVQDAVYTKKLPLNLEELNSLNEKRYTFLEKHIAKHEINNHSRI